EMQDRLRSVNHDHIPRTLFTSERGDADGVLAYGNCREGEVASRVRHGRRRPVRRFPVDHQHRALHSAMSRVLGDPAHGTDGGLEYCRAGTTETHSSGWRVTSLKDTVPTLGGAYVR